jgi:hypothetical protein
VLLSKLFLYYANIIDLVPYKWYQITFLGRKLWVKFFFRVETHFDVLNLQGYVFTCIYPWSRSHTRRKYKWYLSTHLLATLINHIVTPSSGSTLDITCIQIVLYLLNPSIDKPIDYLIYIVPLRKALKNIISST